MWFVWRVHYCVLLLPEVILFFNIPFICSFANIFLFSQLVFLFRILRNIQFSKIYDALLKPNYKSSFKQFFKGVVHEQPWYTIVWFVWRVHYCVLLLPEVMIFLTFFNYFLYLFLCYFFSFNYLVIFLVSFVWNSQKYPISQNIWCLIKT